MAKTLTQSFERRRHGGVAVTLGVQAAMVNPAARRLHRQAHRAGMAGRHHAAIDARHHGGNHAVDMLADHDLRRAAMPPHWRGSSRRIDRPVRSLLRRAIHPCVAERVRHRGANAGSSLPTSSCSRTTKPPPTEHQRSAAIAWPSASSNARKAMVLGWRGVAPTRSITRSMRRIERHFLMHAQQPQPVRVGGFGQQPPGFGRIRPLSGACPARPKQNGAVGGMAMTGPGQRAEQDRRAPGAHRRKRWPQPRHEGSGPPAWGRWCARTMGRCRS